MSKVCRYFLNNSCGYGNRCRFSHDISGGRSPSPTSSTSPNPYVYIRDRSEPIHNPKKTLSNAEVREIINRIAEEANQVENEHMWPLTCLSVLKDAPNIPGWEDYSMEEIRAAAYSSKVAGCFEEYVKFFTSLQQKAKDNRAIFIRPGKRAEEIVRSIFDTRNQEPPQLPISAPKSTSPFNSSKIPAFGQGASSTFGAATPFGSSGFGSQTSSTTIAANSPFGSTNPFSSKDSSAGIFAMAARGFKQASVSSQSTNINDTAMETATDATLSLSAASPFNQNIFGQVVQSPPSRSLKVEGTALSVYGCAVYTPMDQLTEEELEQFKAPTFTLDKLPLRPPPQELC